MILKMPEELLNAFSDYVASRMGLHFPPERRRELEQGLLSAAPELGYDDAEACARRLLLSPLTKQQVETLASHLTVGETYFFRDRKLFEILESRILPVLIEERRKTGQQLRIWSAGCATGEEPYSIAILLRKVLRDIEDWNVTVLATDINPAFLRRATSGVYGEWSFRDVPPWIKERYFRKAGRGRYKILSDIRKRVVFAYHNLAEDPYPSLVNNTNAMDLIFCRNVLMYFTKDRQKEVTGKFYQCLVDQGLLIMSPIETSAPVISPFVPERFQEATLYRKNPGKHEARRTKEEGREIKSSIAPASDASAQPSSINAVPSGRVSSIREIPVPEPPRAVTIDPYAEALALFESGRLSESEQQITGLLALPGRHAAALALLARIRANRGELADAGGLCEKAIAEDKLNPGYQFLRATIQLELGLLDESVESLKRALYLDQNFVLAHFSLGNLALRQGKVRSAGRHFGNALSALKTLGRDDILPESGGVTAGRLEEIIRTANEEVIPA